MPVEGKFEVAPPNRAIVLKNVTCCYCGKEFGPDLKATKEHVIGRGFVPKGVFNGQWNLILNACSACNGDKSDLEDDISVITMMPDASNRFAVDDPRLEAEIARKGGKSHSRRTGKPVTASHEQVALQFGMGPASMSLRFNAPAQIDPRRIYRLAQYHLGGFFYLHTYQKETKRGGFVPGEFHPIVAARRADWGNVKAVWFGNLVRGWELRRHAIGADGFFKFVLLRHPDGGKLWSWALEWNCSLRVMGFAGDRQRVEAIVRDEPSHDFMHIEGAGRESYRVRVEKPLPDEEDTLFTGPYYVQSSGNEGGL